MATRFLVSALAFMLVAAPGVTLAAADISIGPLEENNCDANLIQVSFDVEVPEEGANDVVEVMFDGTTIFESDDVKDPETLEFEKMSISSGEHTIDAVIWDNDDKDTVLASDSYTFDIDCERSPKIIDDTNRHVLSGGSDDGGDGDCCPGPGGDSGAHDDEGESSEAVSTAKTGTVKGATSVSDLPMSLKPLNSVFRSVFGRNPTVQEWTYWANRFLTDKSDYPALFGAMQWHKLHGRTIGA